MLFSLILKGWGPLFLKVNLNILHPRMFCSKFGWNWLSGSGVEDFKILKIYFHSFVIISLWKRMRSLFEQTWIPFIKGCFVPSLFESGPVVLEKKIWKVYDNNNNDTWQRTNCDQKAHLGLWLKWAKSSLSDNLNEIFTIKRQYTVWYIKYW